jgi:putative ABC transport system permease protein
MHRWLEAFAYRTSIHWWVFGIVGLMAFLIALFTVSFQAIRAAVSNPVNSLRAE